MFYFNTIISVPSTITRHSSAKNKPIKTMP
nr:MAG TPA: hypothetical protein [Caudoviricetes sp.]